jgi:predicted GNAT family N-acyltransferase
MGGYKFRRQVVIEPYIADFVCYEAKLIIEADGGQHVVRQSEDRLRSAFLEQRGYRLLRFWNHDILNDTRTVLARIHHALTDCPCTGSKASTMNSFDPDIPPYTIRLASWQQDKAALRLIRTQVFIQEQAVPEALEWDGEDETALHFLAETNSGSPIGTARLLQDGHIGRVAVLPEWRGRGVGAALMRRAMQEAGACGHSEAFLDAQLDAIAFYQRLGFQTEGEIFMDAGIPHRHMRLRLAP